MFALVFSMHDPTKQGMILKNESCLHDRIASCWRWVYHSSRCLHGISYFCNLFWWEIEMECGFIVISWPGRDVPTSHVCVGEEGSPQPTRRRGANEWEIHSSRLEPQDRVTFASTGSSRAATQHTHLDCLLLNLEWNVYFRLSWPRFLCSIRCVYNIGPFVSERSGCKK